MPRKIYSSAAQFVASSTTRTLHAGPGKIYSIIVVNDSATTGNVNLYDGTSTAGALILLVPVNSAAPFILHLPQNTPITFTNGLTIATATNVRAFLITEAEA